MHESTDDEKSALNKPGVPATLPEASLRELVNARLVTGFVTRGDEGGFVVEAHLGDGPGRAAILGNTRGGPRVFASLATVAVPLRKFGFTQFMVDSTKYVPGRVRAARPERSAAMKSAVFPIRKSTRGSKRKG
jgi:hypothetical protein